MNKLRQERIKAYILEHETATIRQLHALCPEVTTMTLHRDLDALAAAGYIVKVHGGARAAQYSGEQSFQARAHVNLRGKKAIAQKALAYVQAGSALFLDAGTTCLALLQELPDMNVTVFTTGANFAQELQRLTKTNAVICGGSLNRYNMALSGHSTLTMLEEINIDVCFIGVSGYAEGSGFTCGKESEMLVKKKVIQKARTAVMLLDHTKLSKLMPYTFATLADIDVVVSDEAYPEEFVRAANTQGVVLL